MSVSAFRCDSPTRRALLVGIGASVPLAGLMARHGGFAARRASDDGSLRVADLVDADGGASELARERLGRTITVRGFQAPALRSGAAFDLYERATAPCLSCGLIHDPGASLAVRGGGKTENGPAWRPLRIAGRLEIDDRGAPLLVIA